MLCNDWCRIVYHVAGGCGVCPSVFHMPFSVFIFLNCNIVGHFRVLVSAKYVSDTSLPVLYICKLKKWWEANLIFILSDRSVIQAVLQSAPDPSTAFPWCCNKELIHKSNASHRLCLLLSHRWHQIQKHQSCIVLSDWAFTYSRNDFVLHWCYGFLPLLTTS